MENINNKEYWDNRFGSGDWEEKHGGYQTTCLTEAYLRYINLPAGFQGSILDFGCGTGESIPVLRQHFQEALLTGTDFSVKAIEKCTERHGKEADFICCRWEDVPASDVIISSNVFEHLTNDTGIAESLLKKCRSLFIIVPYKEELENGGEHVNSYNRHSFDHLNPSMIRVFRSRGWSEYGLDLIFNVWTKNIIKFLLGRKTRRARKQVVFRFDNEHPVR
ncbi:MAG TPA: class I SAM-dependent methyltransferase [Bacteroidales bacterium]|nr:class I SAM-dependent methyltransferase [Bacteroidales bacterium]